MSFRGTLRGCEYSIWATTIHKMPRKDTPDLLFRFPKSSFGRHKVAKGQLVRAEKTKIPIIIPNDFSIDNLTNLWHRVGTKGEVDRQHAISALDILKFTYISETLNKVLPLDELFSSNVKDFVTKMQTLNGNYNEYIASVKLDDKQLKDVLTSLYEKYFEKGTGVVQSKFIKTALAQLRVGFDGDFIQSVNEKLVYADGVFAYNKYEFVDKMLDVLRWLEYD